MMLKKNGHAIFLKYSLEIDLFFLLPTTQKGVHTPSSLGRNSCTNFKWTWKGSVPSYSFLSPPIKITKSNYLFDTTSESPTKT